MHKNVLIGGGGLDYYSLEEKLIKDWFWLDGRPIYRKTFRATTGSSVNTARVVCSTGISDLDTIISLNGFVKNTSGAILVDSSLAYITTLVTYSGFSCWVDAERNICEKHYAEASNNRTFYVTLHYTKSIDPEDPSQVSTISSKGEEMASYSFEERKTNKYWIDKKPVYRKSFSMTTSNIVDTNNQIINCNTLKISNLISLTGFYVVDDTCHIPANFPTVTDEHGILTWVNAAGYLSERHVNAAMSGVSGIITLEYTKVTS